MSNVSNASESDGEVATMTVPQTQTKQPPSAFEPPTSSSHPQSEQVLESVEAAEPRSNAPPSQRRHNTRSSRSVSPSLLLSLDDIDRSQNPKSKGKGRASSTSASSTHQGVEATTARGGKRKVNSDDADDIERATTKRTQEVHRGPVTKKRNIRGKPPGSPIVEADEEDEDTGNIFRRSVKRAKNALTIPRAELEFSYVHVSTPRAPVDEQAQGSNGEPSSSRTHNSTSIDPTTPTPMQAPAQAESSQRSAAKSNETAEERAVLTTPILSTPQQPTAEERAVLTTPLPTTESTSAQSNINNTPLATTSRTPLAVGASSSNGSPVLRQGLTDTRVAQGSARVQRNSSPYLQTNRGSSRVRNLHPPRRTPLTMGSVEIYEDSEHEDDDDKNPWTVEEFKGWKSDLRTARNAYESVVAGERLPEPEPSNNAQEKKIVSPSLDHGRYYQLTISQTRRKLGQTPPASRPRTRLFSPDSLVFPSTSTKESAILTHGPTIDKLRAVFDWTQSSRKNVLPPEETLIAFLDAHVRSAAPSPASQQVTTQPSATKSTPRREEHSSPRNTSNQSGAASPSTSTGGSASPPGEAKQSAQDNESDSESLNNEPKYNMMSPTASEVDDTQELPTTPIQTPSQPASEPRAWPSTILKSVKMAVASPFKFFGRSPTKGGAATTNEAEFTFTHPQQLPQPVTTPTRSSKQHVKPRSEQRVVSNQQSQISSRTRVPQTERRRRQTDKTPVHLRGASSATTLPNSNDDQAATRQQQQAKKTPVHLRGVVPASTIPKSKTDQAATRQQQAKKTPIHLRGAVPASTVPASTMKEFHDEQAATRQQQREAETARLEEEQPSVDKDDWRRPRKFEAPDPNAPASDDDEDDDSDDEANEGQPNLQTPGGNQVTETKSQLLDRLFRTRQAPVAVQQNLYPGRSVRFRDDYDPPVVRQRGPTAALQLCEPGKQLGYTNRVTELDPDDPTNPYYFVRDPSRRTQYYRMVNINEPDWICMNAFDEEALFYMLPGGLHGETYWEIQHGEEVSLRNGLTKLAWATWLNNPANKEKEKDRLMAKWNNLPESKKAALLPGLPEHLKTIMGIKSSGQPQECPAWRLGDTSLEKYEHYRIYEAAKSTSSATASSGTSEQARVSYKHPSPASSDDEESDDEVQTRPARATVQTPQVPATPSPPPKPRPGNAQLPQPLPANTAVANSNQYRQKAETALLHGPSKLRNVTQMSPLQQEESREKELNDKESDKENRVQVNGSTETKESEEAKTKEVMDYIRTLNSQGKILPALLPEAKAMDIQLPPGYPGKYSDYGGEINSAIKAAFGKKN